MKTPKTPEDLAKTPKGKDKYTLYLDVRLMEYIKDRAAKAGVSASQVVNEALGVYVDSIRSTND